MSHIIKSVDAFSHQGFKAVGTPNHYNEDRFVAGTHVFSVIDGATSLVQADMDGLNPSAYTSRFLAEFLTHHDRGDDTTANDLLVEANKTFRAHLKVNWPQIVELGKMGPTAAVAVVKIHNAETMTISNISDCAIVVLKDGMWQLVSQHYDRHAEVDAELGQAIFEEMASGKTYAEARACERVDTMVKRHRCLGNVEFGVFNADEEVPAFLRHATLDLQGVAAVALLSDGLQWAEAETDAEACLFAAQQMHELGVRGYYQKLKALYDADPYFKAHRRLKHMDDSTGLVITLK